MEKSKPGYKSPEKIAPLIIPRHPNTPLGEGIDCTPNKNITSKHQTLRYGVTAGCLRVLGEGIWFDAPTQLWGKKKPRKNRGPTGSGICSMFTIYSKLNLHLFCSTLGSGSNPNFKQNHWTLYIFAGISKIHHQKNQRKPPKKWQVCIFELPNDSLARRMTQTKTKFQTKQPSFGSSSQLSVGHVCPQPISGCNSGYFRLSTEGVGGFIPPKPWGR